MSWWDRSKGVLTEAMWRFFGALFMDMKELPDGTRTRAASLHRLLALVCFAVCLVLWLSPGMEPLPPEVIEALKNGGVDLEQVAATGGKVPEALLQTLWGLLGLNGVNKIAETWAGAKKLKRTEETV